MGAGARAVAELGGAEAETEATVLAPEGVEATELLQSQRTRVGAGGAVGAGGGTGALCVA